MFFLFLSFAIDTPDCCEGCSNFSRSFDFILSVDVMDVVQLFAYFCTQLPRVRPTVLNFFQDWSLDGANPNLNFNKSLHKKTLLTLILPLDGAFMEFKFKMSVGKMLK